jgi:hypothetical protein
MNRGIEVGNLEDLRLGVLGHLRIVLCTGEGRSEDPIQACLQEQCEQSTCATDYRPNNHKTRCRRQTSLMADRKISPALLWDLSSFYAARRRKADCS